MTIAEKLKKHESEMDITQNVDHCTYTLVLKSRENRITADRIARRAADIAAVVSDSSFSAVVDRYKVANAAKYAVTKDICRAVEIGDGYSAVTPTWYLAEYERYDAASSAEYAAAAEIAAELKKYAENALSKNLLSLIENYAESAAAEKAAAAYIAENI